MNATRIVAIALIVAGALGLAYRSFSYTKDTTVVKMGRWRSRPRKRKP